MEFVPEFLVIDTLKDDVKNLAERYPVHYKSRMCYFCPDR